MNSRRTRLDPEWFRREHRIRRFMIAGTDSHSQEGRKIILERLNSVLNMIADIIAEMNAHQ